MIHKSLAETTSKVRLDNFDANIGLDRGAGKIKEICWYIIKMIFFLSAIPYPSRFKVFLLKCFGAKAGKGIIIKPRVNIHFPWKLSMENHIWIGEECAILNFEKLHIGNQVCISQRTFLCGGNHNYRIPSMPYKNGPITLRDGCWIGACSFIGPDVTVGTDSVITACSVVTKDVKPNVICKKTITEFEKKRWKI